MPSIGKKDFEARAQFNNPAGTEGDKWESIWCDGAGEEEVTTLMTHLTTSNSTVGRR